MWIRSELPASEKGVGKQMTEVMAKKKEQAEDTSESGKTFKEGYSVRLSPLLGKKLRLVAAYRQMNAKDLVEGWIESVLEAEYVSVLQELNNLPKSEGKK